MTSEGDEVWLAPGTVYAGYEIVRRLGVGGFGEVYEAVKQESRARVALKVVRVELQDNVQIVVRFMREARAVALLRHPNIVAAVEVGEHQGNPFLAMELLSGEPLGDLVASEGKLPLKRALEIIVPLMAAMRTVHAQGIVHRDLKPDNIFITYTDEGTLQPKILDFGFAKMADPGIRLTGKDTAIGTPNFMSPEQMLTPLGVDPRSDQWALAVLLYYMLSGVKPFEGRNLSETLKNVLQREPETLRERGVDVPDAVASAITRAMRKPPDERFATVNEFAQAILPFATDDTALHYAREFYATSVWDALGEEPPPRTDAEARTRPSRVPRKPRTSPGPRSSASWPPGTQTYPPGVLTTQPGTLSSPPGTLSTPPGTRSAPSATASRPPTPPRAITERQRRAEAPTLSDAEPSVEVPVDVVPRNTLALAVGVLAVVVGLAVLLRLVLS